MRLNLRILLVIVCGFGTLAAIASLPGIIVGHKRQTQYINNYLLGKTIQPKYAHRMPNTANQPYATFRLQPTYDGLGLAVTF